MSNSFRFLHISDTHLGLRQYQLPQRAVDMAKSLKDAFQQGIAAKVDFVVIPGDFFESQDTAPEYFLHAMDCLQVLRDANIPCYMISGNHDKAYWSRRSNSWLEVLNESGYFQLLSPTFLDDGNLRLDAWDPATKSGAVVAPPGAPYRIVGVPHLGNHTEAMIPKLAQAMPRDDRFNIVMMHLGLTGQIADAHDALEKEALDPMRPKTDFLALGHYHREYRYDGWIFNPGGTENRSSAELGFPHGFYIVDVKDGKIGNVDFRPGLRRPYHLLDVALQPTDTTESLRTRILGSILKLPKTAEAPIITVHVAGTLMDQYTSLNLNSIEADLTKATGALIVRLRPKIDRNEVHVSIDDRSSIDRTTLEGQILEQVLPAAFPTLTGQATKDAALAVQAIKGGALSNAKPEDLYAQFEALAGFIPKSKGPDEWQPEAQS